MALTVLLIVLLSTGLVSGFEDGAPITLCYDPYPHHHGILASSDASPYQITLNQTSYSSSDVITVTISGTKRMKGLAVSARSTTGDWMYNYGSFVQIPDGLQGYKYYSNEVNCVTHKDKLPKHIRTIEMEWKAPSKSIGDIVFSATIMHDFETFWVNHTTTLTAKDSVTEQPFSRIKAAGSFDADLDFQKCGDQNGCVKYPAGCTGLTCSKYITYKTIGDKVKFRLMSKDVTTPNFYMSLGISEDIWMNNDETLSCLKNENDKFIFNHGFNPGYHNSVVLKSKVYDFIASLVDGTMMCEFTRPLNSSFTLMSKNPQIKPGDIRNGVDTPKYHLYLGWGEVYKGSYGSMSKHVHLPVISRDKIAFRETKSHAFFTLHDSVKVHAAFMITAWFGTAAIAMIIARYFRGGIIYTDQKLGGLAAWFQVHRGLVLGSTLLTAAAFVLIFSHYQKWTESQDLHAAFGVAVMAMVLIQVLGAMCRPDPNSSRRSIFNWIHRILGMLTYGLAAATMFLGTKMGFMPKQMGSTGTYILAGLVGVHVLFIIIFQCMQSCEGSSQRVEMSNINGFELKGVNTTPSDNSPPVFHGHSTVKSALLFIFIVLVSALLASFLTILWAN